MGRRKRTRRPKKSLADRNAAASRLRVEGRLEKKTVSWGGTVPDKDSYSLLPDLPVWGEDTVAGRHGGTYPSPVYEVTEHCDPLPPDDITVSAEGLHRGEGLMDTVTFPPFRDVTEADDPSSVYYAGWGTSRVRIKRHWAFLATITHVHSLTSVSLSVCTRFGERTKLVFSPESTRDKRDLSLLVPRLKAGHTIVALYAERATLPDLSDVIECPIPSNCYVISAPLSIVVPLSCVLVANADRVGPANLQSAPQECVTCGQTQQRCHMHECCNCGIAAYCSKECRVSDAPTHRALCRATPGILRLAGIGRHRMREPFTQHTLPPFKPRTDCGGEERAQSRE
ncbi:hypothetical protein KIPB_002970 [Kipferlia bialata]|uniref:MYND-type domain-containing protein n=1 Tax=Kipferlia bialata TaxID=797122 RepID=A0A9K3GH32_9EUKA|nr:hypothetical protein KIPB_002970 [Kipferlia bialata]|eukprot:g2970.t1